VCGRSSTLSSEGVHSFETTYIFNQLAIKVKIIWSFFLSDGMVISVSCETCGLLRAVKPAEVCLSRVRSEELLYRGIDWKQILKSELS